MRVQEFGQTFVFWQFRAGQCEVTFTDLTGKNFYSLTASEELGFRYMLAMVRHPELQTELFLEFLERAGFDDEQQVMAIN